MRAAENSSGGVVGFGRQFFGASDTFTRIGGGQLGGKAHGLVFIRDVLAAELDRQRFAGIEVVIPTLTVLATDVFDAFLERNRLADLALSDAPDDRIAHAFQGADLPAEVLGDLRALVHQVHAPLAVRSSSLLEDALFQPFAGVYVTKMIPNNQPDPNLRFRRLIEAIKFVYASTFFRAAKQYHRATDKTAGDEKMAVILQEVVGQRHGDRFYPHLSGVGRSYNFYPQARVRPEQGVVQLALGLGKTIVDGGLCWSFCPAHPKMPPPYASTRELLRGTQTEFWAVNMGRAPQYNPIAETEYLVRADLAAADYDGTLRYLASTYDPASDRLTPGTGAAGTRVLNFAPLLTFRDFPFAELAQALLKVCEQAVGREVEIEFAMTLPTQASDRARLGFLQVRPMVVSTELVEIEETQLARPDLLLASDRALGNGVVDSISDVVYLKPEAFEARHTPAIAAQIERLNTALLDAGRPYVLIGFGRWGSTDPWLGIPVAWGQVCGAKVLVEATLPAMNVELSQGAHFFHNLSSFRVSYFSVHHERRPGIDWQWLAAQPALLETEFLRHLRLERPLLVKVDGRTSRGAVWHG